MKGYSAKLASALSHSVSHLKKALSCLCQGLQSLYCNSYLPAPVKVAWVMLASYYRRAFVVDDASRKNQAASL
jgi:hypothetical protein